MNTYFVGLSPSFPRISLVDLLVLLVHEALVAWLPTGLSLAAQWIRTEGHAASRDRETAKTGEAQELEFL